MAGESRYRVVPDSLGAAFVQLTWRAHGVDAYNFYNKGASLTSVTDVRPVPEPSTWATLLVGLGVAGMLGRETRSSGRGRV